MVVLPETLVDKDTVMREVKSAFLRGKPHFIIVAAEGASTPEKSITQLLIEHVAEPATTQERPSWVMSSAAAARLATTDSSGRVSGAAAVDSLMAGNAGVMVG